MKTIKLVGRYNSFSSVFNKARMYFTMSDDLMGYIKDLYALCLTSGQMSINQSVPCRAEIAELNIKGKKCTITFEMDIDEASLMNLAKYAFDRTVQLTISYSSEEIMERVSGSFYTLLIKTMERLTSAVGMGSIEELKVAINQAYGYGVLINQNMYRRDAEQLYEMVVAYAKEVAPEMDIAMQPAADSFIMKRINAKKCAACEKPMVEIQDGIPLCADHLAERNRTTAIKFREKYYF